MTIYALGTSTRSPQEFISILKRYEIERVVDVRQFPTSRFEHFLKDNLKLLVGDAGIDYVYLGRELGGYRHGGYEQYTTTAEFREGISKLRILATEKRSTVLCAERFPWRCHRRFIALALERCGWEVVHILDEGRVWVPSRSKQERQEALL